MFLAKVFVTLKTTVNDPQGQTVHVGLSDLGFDSVHNVRVGKYIAIELDVVSARAAGDLVNEMCEKLLANPVIEDYRFELERLGQGRPARRRAAVE